MKLQISQRIVADFRFVHARGVQAESADRIRYPDVVGGVADQRPAADERDPEAHAFLFGEPHHFNLKRQPAARQHLHQRDADHYAQDAVECPGAGNGIEVGPDQQTAPARISRCIDATHVAHRVDGYAHPGLLHPLAHFGMHAAHRIGQEGTRGESRLHRILREPAAARHAIFGYRFHQEPRYVL